MQEKGLPQAEHVHIGGLGQYFGVMPLAHVVIPKQVSETNRTRDCPGKVAES